MNTIKKRTAAVLLTVLLGALFCFSSFAATANEYGLGLTTAQEADRYAVTLRNQHDFAVSGVSVTCGLPGGLSTSGRTDAAAQNCRNVRWRPRQEVRTKR